MNIGPEDILQMAQDVQAHGNEGYSNALISRVTNSLASPEWKEKLIKILSGKFRQEVEDEFLRQNNNTDKRLIKNVAKKWVSKGNQVRREIKVILNKEDKTMRDIEREVDQLDDESREEINDDEKKALLKSRIKRVNFYFRDIERIPKQIEEELE